VAELVHFEVKDFPAVLLIGKELRYSMELLMKGENRIPAFWDACFADGTFTRLEGQKDGIFDDAYVGVMLDWGKGDGDFSYVCGMLMKDGADVPDGYISRVLPASKVAVGWIKGTDTMDVSSAAHVLTERKLKEEGRTSDKMAWCMELYNCPRFTTPDADGKIILDYYIPCD
jgi:predicted transcriptional regulator YdeE